MIVSTLNNKSPSYVDGEWVKSKRTRSICTKLLSPPDNANNKQKYSLKVFLKTKPNSVYWVHGCSEAYKSKVFGVMPSHLHVFAVSNHLDCRVLYQCVTKSETNHPVRPQFTFRTDDYMSNEILSSASEPTVTQGNLSWCTMSDFLG